MVENPKETVTELARRLHRARELSEVWWRVRQVLSQTVEFAEADLIDPYGDTTMLDRVEHYRHAVAAREYAISKMREYSNEAMKLQVTINDFA